MYYAHWGLSRPIFGNQVDARRFYNSPAHEEALARLHFLVEDGRRLGILLGERGSGKSLLLEVFTQAIRRAGRPVARVRLFGLSPRELLWQVAAELGAEPHGQDDGAIWREVVERIVEYRYQRRGAVILLDDADEADAETLRSIVRLSQCDTSGEARHTIVLTANPARAGKLGPRLLELSELRIDLDRFSLQDTRGYLEQSLRQAGVAKTVFDSSAIERIHELSGGLPRRVNQLADLALLAGAGQQLDSIDAATVDAAHEELAVGTV